MRGQLQRNKEVFALCLLTLAGSPLPLRASIAISLIDRFTPHDYFACLANSSQWILKHGYSRSDVRGRDIAGSLYKRIIPRYVFWREVMEGRVKDVEEVLERGGRGRGKRKPGRPKRSSKGGERHASREATDLRTSASNSLPCELHHPFLKLQMPTIVAGIEDKPPLNLLTTAGDERFAAWCGASLENYKAWKEGEGGQRAENEVRAQRAAKNEPHSCVVNWRLPE